MLLATPTLAKQCGSASQKSFIFCSPELNSKSKIVVLIHGSGVVRAGQWARRLIINEVID